VLLSDMQEGFFVVDVDALALRLVNDPPYHLPEGLVVRVRAHVDAEGSPLDAGSVTLVASVDGAPEVSVSMNPVGGDDFVADLPLADCGAEISWYVQADNDDGTTFTLPAGAPVEAFTSTVVSGLGQVLIDDFEADQGWTVQNTNVSSGAWERDDPVGTSAQPEDDSGDGTFCFFTGQGQPGAHVSLDDLDGGPTRLLSPAFDLDGDDAVIRYHYWHYNLEGDDPLIVELSDDDGANWTEVVRHEFGAGGWFEHAFRVSDHIAPSAQVRLRFTISDNPTNSITEAAIDEVKVQRFDCTWQDLGSALSAGNIPFEGGVLVPDVTPPGFFVTLFTDGTGGFVIQETWPQGIPSGFELYLQYWMLDPAGVFGWSGSNALKATAP
jgi:hypothetical protein